MIRRILLATGLCLSPLVPTAALAQVPPATIGERYVPAPWWMRDPVIASMGNVRIETPANRASFSATFQEVDRNVNEATRKAADRVRAVSQLLAGYGEEAVRVETTLSTRPLYDQYRDENGIIRENARADQIERYQADANVRIDVRDVAVLERVYATIMAANPTSVGAVSFSLVPSNETTSWLAERAVKDAADRARASAENAGASLGRVRVIDPSGRACQTDVLAGWPSYGNGVGAATDATADYGAVVGARAQSYSAPPPPPPPPSAAQIDAARLALQPPQQQLTAQACVVYGLD